MTVRVWVPVWSQVPVKPPQTQGPYVVAAQPVVPSVSRVHEPVSVVVDGAHAPDAHEYVVTDRERVPVSSHALLKPPHALHVPYVVAAHPVIPSVSRVHEPVSVDVDGAHAPDAHEYVVTDRERVPVSSHMLLNPPHALHVPYVVAAHPVIPSVSRVHEPVSVDVDGAQAADAHAYVVTDRERVPVSSHMLL